MENLLLSRLKQRHERLSALVPLVIETRTQTLHELELKQHLLELKSSVENLDSETKYYLSNSKNPDNDLVCACLETQTKAEDLLISLQKDLIGTGSSSSETTKLPELGLPTFNGCRTQWNEFWDRFNSSVHTKDLPEVDKLAYLFSCLQGVAAKAVAGLSTTTANYEVAIQTLKGRFGSGIAQIDSHYVALNNVPMANDSTDSCRTTLDSIEHHLRILETLGEPSEGNHYRAMILGKFPEKIIRDVYIMNDGDESMKTLRKNLHRIVSAMERPAVLRPQFQEQSPGESLQSTSTTTEALYTKAVPATSGSNKKQQSNSNNKANQAQKRSHYETARTEPPKKKMRSCIFCELPNHQNSACPKYKTQEARLEKLKTAGRCIRCLRNTHKTEECHLKPPCFRCQGDHLMLFCPIAKEKSEQPNNIDENIASQTVCNLNHVTYLQTAVARIRNPNDVTKITSNRLLLDSGSQRSYITRKAARILGLESDKQDMLLIYTFGAANPKETLSPSSEIVINTKRGVTRKMQVNIVERITDKVPIARCQKEEIDIPADDDTVGEGIDLLIGNDYYSSFMKERKIELSPYLYLIDTDFGWIVSGNTQTIGKTATLTVSTYCQCHTPSCPYFTEPDLPLRNIDIKFLWLLESIGITDNPKATRQEEAVKYFMETVQYLNGRYYVKWPWIQYPPELPSNYGLAIGRLRSLLKRIDRDSLQEYDTILKEQLKSGIIEEIDPKLDNNTNQPIHYLPHHMVQQKGKRGRLVYDASAKISGQKSLNECLYSGPSFLEDLTALLLKFRMKKIGILADVEKAFLQVGLQEEDRDVTRFLWIKDLSLNKDLTDDNLMYLRFCRVPFGIICSPMLLTATIRHHMAQSTEGDLLKTIADKIYVDNLVVSADTVQEAIQIYKQTRATFEQIGMNIRDWTSNNEEFMKIVPRQHQADHEGNVKVLGLSWNVSKDVFKLKISDQYFEQDPSTKTKRMVLRDMARIYDPLGFVCPLVLPMKILFQNICQLKLKWDAELPEDFKQILEANMRILQQVQHVELPRCVGIGSPDADYELHAFTDASKNAYAAVVYLRTKDELNITVSFIMGKSRISRLEDKDDLRIPRLELLGFLIGSKMLTYLKTNLGHSIKREYLWTDSLVVLGWMNSNKLLPPFVANRVNEIKKNHPQTEMYYVNTKSNPADVATRPELWEQKKNLWFDGPDFLEKHEIYWPEDHHYRTHQTLLSFGEVPEESSVDKNSVESTPQELMGTNNPECTSQKEASEPSNSELMETDDPEPISQKEQSESGYSSTNETVMKIKEVQNQYFPLELTGKTTHLSRNLNLFLDVDGLLRCRGRMANTTWSYDMKYPVLLPKDCEFTNQIIREIHERNYHVGPTHTLSLIRERYWIPQGKTQVQKMIRRCAQCTKHGGGPYKLPATPALPPERVNYSDPFTFTGVDYFGPLFVNTATGKEKRWVALFTCLAIRAIHLEVVKDLTAEECLLALRRFVATRGTPKRMYSDNATCFKLTSEVMTKPFCIEHEIEWRFNPQLAPWFGSYYERLIGIVKNCLKRTLEKHLLNDSKLVTVIKEVEAVINSRPITQVGTELDHTLRPADFLSLKRCLMIEPTTVETPNEGTSTKIDLIQSWKRGLKIIEEFKQMFISQYLMSLRERTKHLPKEPRIKAHRSPQVGDVVQIWSDSKNRDTWKTGKIIALIKGVDNECRVAKVQTKDSILIRSIGHLYPLEADDVEKQPNLDLEPRNVLTKEAVRTDPEEQKHMQDGAESVQDVCQMEENTSNPERETTENEIEIIGNHEEDVEQQGTLAVGETIEEPPTEMESTLRRRRDAAIRASERIREWTRHLLTLLQ